MAAFMSGFKDGRQVIVPVPLEFTSELNLFTWNDNIQSFGSEQRVSSGVSSPRHLVRQFQSLYTPSLRGQLPRHIVRQFQSPYTPSPRAVNCHAI
jgi:hypothetical protein